LVNDSYVNATSARDIAEEEGFCVENDDEGFAAVAAVVAVAKDALDVEDAVSDAYVVVTVVYVVVFAVILVDSVDVVSSVAPLYVIMCIILSISTWYITIIIPGLQDERRLFSRSVETKL